MLYQRLDRAINMHLTLRLRFNVSQLYVLPADDGGAVASWEGCCCSSALRDWDCFGSAPLLLVALQLNHTVSNAH
jgi:hypothetical protein